MVCVSVELMGMDGGGVGAWIGVFRLSVVYDVGLRWGGGREEW